MKRLLAIVAALFCLAAAAVPADRLPDPAQEARARAIFREVRCLVCQNESIDDSQADLASDLRRLVRDQIRSGKSDASVRSYLVSRYGEFVLLKPSFSWGNGLLWAAPVLVLGLGGLLLARNLRGRPDAAELSPEELARLSRLSDVKDS